MMCFANDAEGVRGNNCAALRATVAREAWPPNVNIETEYEAYVDDAPTRVPLLSIVGDGR